MPARSTRTFALGCLVGLVAPLGLTVASASRPPSRRHAEPKPVLRVVKVKDYGDVLSTASGHTLYLLSVEAHSKVVCKGACLKIWPPLLVPARDHHVTVAHDVKGHIGFVARTKTHKQVTLNGYPLYTFVGDKKPAGTAGEGITHFGGTWYLVRPGATKPAATWIKPAPAATAPPSSSTTTSSSSGSGYPSGGGSSSGSGYTSGSRSSSGGSW